MLLDKIYIFKMKILEYRFRPRDESHRSQDFVRKGSFCVVIVSTCVISSEDLGKIKVFPTFPSCLFSYLEI